MVKRSKRQRKKQSKKVGKYFRYTKITIWSVNDGNVDESAGKPRLEIKTFIFTRRRNELHQQNLSKYHKEAKKNYDYRDFFSEEEEEPSRIREAEEEGAEISKEEYQESNYSVITVYRGKSKKISRVVH